MSRYPLLDFFIFPPEDLARQSAAITAGKCGMYVVIFVEQIFTFLSGSIVTSFRNFHESC